MSYALAEPVPKGEFPRKRTGPKRGIRKELLFMEWTIEQKQAIGEKGVNILVAAAARKSEKLRC